MSRDHFPARPRRRGRPPRRVKTGTTADHDDALEGYVWVFAGPGVTQRMRRCDAINEGLEIDERPGHGFGGSGTHGVRREFMNQAEREEVFNKTGVRVEDRADMREAFESKGRYKLFGVVTNRELPGDAAIWWYRERCGKSEEAHAVMKHDLAGGTLPSGLFGANAAWWAIMVLAHNLNATMKRLVLGPAWVARRMKALRLALIALPGRVIRHARRLHPFYGCRPQS